MPRFYVPAFSIEVNGAALIADVSANIQSVTVISQPDLMDHFSFTLANAPPKMRWTHTTDANLFQLGSEVTIKMGYVDDLHEIMNGEIITISPDFPGSGMPTVEISGKSMMHRLAGCTKVRAMDKTKPHLIVQDIGTAANFTVEAEEIDVELDYAIQCNQTDLSFLRSIARQHHFELVMNRSKLIFRKAKEADPQTMNFIWCGPQEGFSAPSGTFPLTSFRPTMDGQSVPTSVKVNAHDRLGKQLLTYTATSSNQSSPMNGTEKAADVAANQMKRSCSVVHVTTPFASVDEVKEHAIADFNERSLNFVTGTAETIGIPQLTAGQTIRISGLGFIFDVTYLTQEVTHRIGDSGYTTGFSVKRNARGDENSAT